MRTAIAIAAGGALGALARVWLASAVAHLAGRAFPWGTLAVNVLGSLAMGALYVVLVERVHVDPVWRAALLAGLLGAFTTYSTFSLETMLLIEAGEPGKALANAGASVVLCVGACWVGMLAARQM